MEKGAGVSEYVEGLYDQLIDELFGASADALAAHRLQAAVESVDPAEMADRIGEVVGRWAAAALSTVGIDDRQAATLNLSAALLSEINRLHPDAVDPARQPTDPVQRLTAIERLAPTGDPIPIRRPITPLRDTVLMTNARDQPSVGREIAAEIESADRIDVVMAFIRWTGIRELLPALRRHVEQGKPLRIITTTYTRSTERRALEALTELGAQVRVSYDESSTRLHAKAWMFERATGFSTVYIGSSNLSFSAQVTGLEWNVRASQRLNPDVVTGFQRAFTTYWADTHFETFNSEQFAEAMATPEDDDSILTPFAIEPYPFQRQMLERLQVDRRRGHPHNLVVAATGTGKTIVAALDYRNLREELDRSRLLFVAHRAEILQQSQATFRHVLRDGSFGELWVGGHRPNDWQHVFASIQSLSANDVEAIDPEQFDVVIVDEFHHAAANTYEALLDHLRPKHLLGLTATPERTDGLDILRWFGERISVELRLWDALEQGLLSPFHYFGIHDGTDLSGVTWRRGKGYDTRELTNVYTADDMWTSKVIAAVGEKIGDPKQMRALGFCVSIEHAEFMAKRFETAGITSLAVTSKTTAKDRSDALTALRTGKVQVLFTVDLFNEGVDIPEIDVVLMLRPTESATIFLQQLGRGLRRSRNKDVLTVLDFVGHQGKEFRFDLRYRRLLGRTRLELERDIKEEFPYLPAGCHLELDAVARDIVLDNIRHALPTTWKQRVQELRELGDVALPTYLAETGLEREDIYRGNHTWTELRRSAGISITPAADGEDKAGRGIARLLHVDDQERIDTYRELLRAPHPPKTDQLDERVRRQFEGLLLTVLNPRKGTYATLDHAAAALWRHSELRHELLALLPMLEDQIVHLHQPLGLLQPVPLQVHANYTREEILAAFGASSVTAPLPLQTGVYWHQPTKTDLFFVTLQKTEKDYSPTTRYLDYAISDRLFHWESQATTSVASRTGQRYLTHRAGGSNVALFVRPTKQDSNSRTMPYFCAGTASYVEHRSDRPIQITWELDHPLPGDIFAAFRAAVA
jgi:superfamily II DNA or RNA helicase